MMATTLYGLTVRTALIWAALVGTALRLDDPTPITTETSTTTTQHYDTTTETTP